MKYKYSKYLRFYEDSDEKVYIFNVQSKKIISVGKKEYLILKSLDGASSLEEIGQSHAELSAREIERMLQLFDKFGLLERYSRNSLNLLRMKLGISNRQTNHRLAPKKRQYQNSPI